ncbi:hypothetical protein BDK51DRAFT_38508 [Blyttiomyces helicus]|uniref:HNH nuclease domain-containing protein n=1 Tax=Blyttiomyces helicus TaxID=388810 RepID=A0A4P9WAJ7_9FUNG|nr:hypothetical protein BDK51DRAFT_38508 [Blyttiomyces helicus]|eukprot:RKO87266.1 hypothetical protein BDK51DRAFT_38508 [Blyttiomyces helicus]
MAKIFAGCSAKISRPEPCHSRKGSRSSVIPGSPQPVLSATATTPTPVATVSTEAADSAPGGGLTRSNHIFACLGQLSTGEAVKPADAITTISAGSPETVDKVDLSVVDKASDERRRYQKELRWTCLRRDQVWTLMAVCSGNVLKCCHVLTPEYAKDWFSEGQHSRLTAGIPSVKGVSSLGYDIKNAYILQSTLHDSFDSFEFSVWLDNDKFFRLFDTTITNQLELIYIANPDKPWDYSRLSANLNVTMEMVKAHPEKPWNYECLSKDPNILMEVIKANLDKPWDFYFLSENPNISMDFVNSNPDKPWNFPSLIQNSNITMDIVKANSDKPWD